MINATVRAWGCHSVTVYGNVRTPSLLVESTVRTSGATEKDISIEASHVVTDGGNTLYRIRSGRRFP